MALSSSHFLQVEQWNAFVYIIHMFRWLSGFKMHHMPMRCLHISQTISYHHLSSDLCEVENITIFCMNNRGFINGWAVKSVNGVAIIFYSYQVS